MMAAHRLVHNVLSLSDTVQDRISLSLELVVRSERASKIAWVLAYLLLIESMYVDAPFLEIV